MPESSKGRNVAQDAVSELITREQWDEWARAMWEIATSGTRVEFGTCRKCHHKGPMDKVDLMARVNAGKQLQEMGFGKPRDDAASERGFILNRIIVTPGGS